MNDFVFSRAEIVEPLRVICRIRMLSEITCEVLGEQQRILMDSRRKNDVIDVRLCPAQRNRGQRQFDFVPVDCFAGDAMKNTVQPVCV